MLEIIYSFAEYNGVSIEKVEEVRKRKLDFGNLEQFESALTNYFRDISIISELSISKFDYNLKKNPFSPEKGSSEKRDCLAVIKQPSNN